MPTVLFSGINGREVQDTPHGRASREWMLYRGADLACNYWFRSRELAEACALNPSPAEVATLYHAQYRHCHEGPATEVAYESIIYGKLVNNEPLMPHEQAYLDAACAAREARHRK